jgi:hypothetical protein
MKEIHTNLYIGNDDDCDACTANMGVAVVHACKSCHQKELGYSGALPATHPEYLIRERGSHLYLNMVDMPNELLPEYTHPMVERAMGFIINRIKTQKVLIHCNFGMSRSPSLGLVYLARTGAISNSSLDAAAVQFQSLYPKYSPGTGIFRYMKRHWQYLMNLQC